MIKKKTNIINCFFYLILHIFLGIYKFIFKRKKNLINSFIETEKIARLKIFI